MLQRQGGELKSIVSLTLHQHEEKLRKAIHEITSGYKFNHERQHYQLGLITSNLPRLVKSKIESTTSQIQNLEKAVEILHPVNVLKRGYSITTINNKSIGQKNDVKKGDLITTRTATFILESEITSKEEHHD